MYKFSLILLTFKYVDSQMSGHVLGGQYTNINSYPHSVFLDIKSIYRCICGGSILNQNIVLSAAHCFDEYKGTVNDKVIIKYGSSTLESMKNTVMMYYRLHDYYDQFTMEGDISLLRCKAPIHLGMSVKRVAIMKFAPKEKLAFVAGWGAINVQQDLPKGIKHTKQEIQSTRVCGSYLNLPPGTLCAGPIKGAGHPAVGDSGSALVVQKYIQIGIVSYKLEQYSLVVYTNVSYYYEWIRRNSDFIYCANKGKK